MSKHHSPLLGYNNNVRHKGRVFHIQTEDSGVKHPHVITHLFMDGGRILKSTKTSYADHIGTPEMADTVRKMMKDQHKAMFTALRDGQFDNLFEARPSMVPPPKAPSVPPPRSERPPRASERPPRASEKPPRASERPPRASEQPPAPRLSARPPVIEDVPPATLRESAPPSLTLDFDDAFAAAAFEPDLPPPPANLLQKHTPEPGTGGRYRTLRDPRVDPDSSSELKVAKRSDEAPRSSRAEPRANATSQRDPRVDPESSGAMRAATRSEDDETSSQRIERVDLKSKKGASERPAPARGASADPKERARRSSRPPKPGYAPARPAAIFGQAQRPQPPGSIFGEDLISDKSLDEVILSYLAEDLEGEK